MSEKPHRLVADRLKKVDELREAGIDPYPHTYERRDHAAAILAANKDLKPETRTKTKVAIAGRIMLLRKMGKAAFGHVEDSSGRIQFFATAEELGENYLVIKKLDIGDILGIEGTIMTTKTGEITIHIEKATMLTKSIRPLPEKHHGLKDEEIRHRKRYLDLITNPEVKERFKKRAAIIKTLREILDKKGMTEVETPTLQPIYGGANARPFVTHHNVLKQDLFLRISDELYLKRLIVGGFDGVYEICKDFRNEGVDTEHNPEFTMLEWYQAYGDYNDGMALTEELIATAAKAVNDGKTKLSFNGKELDLTPPFRRATMAELIREHGKIDVLSMDEAALKKECDKAGIKYEKYDTWGILVQELFEHYCEEHLWKPTFVIDHPLETSPLTKSHRSGDARIVERFELYIAQMEMGNAYSELNDPVVQRERLEQQVARKEHGDEEAQPMDEDFVESIEHGMPPTSGVGLGVDRLVMILTDSTSIRDVIFFPAVKDDKVKKGSEPR